MKEVRRRGQILSQPFNTPNRLILEGGCVADIRFASNLVFADGRQSNLFS